jgi:hypothetical protein
MYQVGYSRLELDEAVAVCRTRALAIDQNEQAIARKQAAPLERRRTVTKSRTIPRCGRCHKPRVWAVCRDCATEADVKRQGMPTLDIGPAAPRRAPAPAHARKVKDTEPL